MREIEFRGKSNVELLDDDIFHEQKPINIGDWVYGCYVDGFIINGVVEANEEYIAIENWCSIDEETLGQYTGLKDENGVKIFEGDIVKTIALNNDHHQRGAVIISPIAYHCGNACLSITYVPLYPFCLSHDIEVIGNIYDNPELLEVRKW